MACALGMEQDCNECIMCGNGKGGKKMTNFERIKEMSVEELAEFLLETNLKIQQKIHVCLLIACFATKVAKIVLRNG